MRFVLVYDSNNPKRMTDRYQIIRTYRNSVHQAIKNALEDAGYQVFPIKLETNFEREISKIQPDFAYNCSSECKKGLEVATAPSILQQMGIPFTGSNAHTCHMAYYKNHSKQVMKTSGIPTPRSFIVRNPKKIQIPNNLSFPLFLKPIRGGCSYGIGRESLVMEKKDLREKLLGIYMKIKQPVLIEEFISGREFTVGILGNHPLRVLPIMEFCNKNNNRPFRSYSLKMIDYKDEVFQCPAEITNNKREELEDLAIKAYESLGCRDYARVDLRLDCQGQPYVLEINALPSLIPETSSYAIMAKNAGLIFNKLIKTIVNNAAKRYGMCLS